MSAATMSAMTSMNALQQDGMRIGIYPIDCLRSLPKRYTLSFGLGLNALLDNLQYALACYSPMTVLSAPVSMHTPL
jgi:hypothetical protein